MSVLSEPGQYSHLEWLTRGLALFGPYIGAWRWECPLCGNIQTRDDCVRCERPPWQAYRACLRGHTNPDGVLGLAPVRVQQNGHVVEVFGYGQPMRLLEVEVEAST